MYVEASRPTIVGNADLSRGIASTLVATQGLLSVVRSKYRLGCGTGKTG